MHPDAQPIHRLPRAVVFDLGKVLLEFDYRIAARALAADSDLDADAILEILDQSPLLHRYECGALDSRAFEREVRERTGYRGATEAFGWAFADIFTEVAAMTGVLDELRRIRVPAFLFSNTNELAVRHIQSNFKFFEAFERRVLSYEVGAMKPDTRAYEAVESVTGLQGADLLFLDDRADNIAGAKRRGWQVILHECPDRSRNELRRRFALG